VWLVLGLATAALPRLAHGQAPIPSHLWSQRFGDIDNDRGQAVAVDGSGNVLLAGWFNGTVDFGGGGLISAGAEDIFVAKFTAAGSHLWSKRFGSTGTDRARVAAVDGSGNVVVAGAFSGTVDFGGGGLISAGGLDIFVAKFSGADGSHIWSKRYGSTGTDGGAWVAVDGSGNILLTAAFQGTVDFGGGGLTSAGDDDIVVAKFSGADGSHIWSKRYGDTGTDDGFGVAVDGSGNVLVTGQFQGTVDFGGGGLTSAGGLDIFVAKFSGANGSHVWSKRFGDTNNDQCFSVAVDGSGNVLVPGFFQGTVDFGGGGLTSAGGFDIFVAKFSGADGSHLWSKRYGDTGADLSTGAAVDGGGNVLVTGNFQGTVDFGGGGLISAGDFDIFVAKFSGADGSHLWSKSYGDTAIDTGATVAVDGGNVLATGNFQGTVDFGGGGLTSAGNGDVFLLKLGVLSANRRGQLISE
jgi:lambda repressor-like predicted transcriptional regulator